MRSLLFFISLLTFLTSALLGCGDDRRRGPVGDSAVIADSGMGGDTTIIPPGDGGGGDTSVVDSPLVDPTCTDGMYAETLPNPGADISDLVASYDPAEFQFFIDSILDRRYPIGAYVVRGGRVASPPLIGGECDALFVGSPTPSIDQVWQRLGVIVHECGHLFDIGMGGFGNYAIRPDLTLSCSGGDSSRTFARSELLTDDYEPLWDACRERDPRETPCNSYADTYLIDDGSSQGFDSVLEEATQYVNSIANAYAFMDQTRPGVSTSDIDGILTFLWFIERYLRLARTDYPDVHAFILSDSCWREAILTIWGRAWLFLETTRGIETLGIHEAVLFPLVEDPDLLAEIQAVRDAHGCGM